MTTIKLRLPWPPSSNMYWRRHGVHIHLSKKATQYREDVQATVWESSRRYTKPLTTRLDVSIELTAGTRRKYDIDNRIKVLLDALEYAGVFDDDEQIDHLDVSRMPAEPGTEGCADVVISEIR